MVRLVPGGREGGALLTWADRLVLSLVIGIGVALFFVPRAGDGAGLAVIEGADGFETSVPLADDREFEVPGPLGVTVVQVEDGAVRIVSSPCPRQTCVTMGRAERPGDVVVCVPNRVVVSVVGGGPQRVDATTR